MHLSRREFLAATAVGAGAVTAGPLMANPLGMPIGTQTYPIRDALGKDFPGTLKQVAAMGYKNIEMCSPPAYKEGFGALAGMSAAEMKKTIQAAGLRCESCHYQFREMKENLDERIAFARELGLKQMILSTFGLPNTATMADWAKAAGELNRIGEKVAKAGMQAGFHNHNFEFQKIDGELIYDRLMGELDPKLIKMQFQVAVISIGYEAATYMKKYPGRFLSMHLADWSAATKKDAAIGAGSVDWKELFAAAKTGGVKNYFVEMNLEFMKPSYDFLHGLQ
jgi:sugar phosphate isomerase/epimerase